jgi:hypothetical protein
VILITSNTARLVITNNMILFIILSPFVQIQDCTIPVIYVACANLGQSCEFQEYRYKSRL